MNLLRRTDFLGNRKWRKVPSFSLDSASEVKVLYLFFDGTFILIQQIRQH